LLRIWAKKAKAKTPTIRMNYPYVFEYAVEAGLIKDGRLVEPLIEPSTTDLIAEFNRDAILKMTEKMGRHSMIDYWLETYLKCTNCFAGIHQFS
jgi:hypothetical protein